jgi:Rrf2 family iron-sulfur cluster assembly transcriptional regulator
LRATRCAEHGKGCMLKGEKCLTHDLWEEVGHQLHDYLSSVSLADVAAGRLKSRRPVAA